jgi:hypothetical protein
MDYVDLPNVEHPVPINEPVLVSANHAGARRVLAFSLSMSSDLARSKRTRQRSAVTSLDTIREEIQPHSPSTDHHID